MLALYCSTIHRGPEIHNQSFFFRIWMQCVWAQQTVLWKTNVKGICHTQLWETSLSSQELFPGADASTHWCNLGYFKLSPCLPGYCNPPQDRGEDRDISKILCILDLTLKNSFVWFCYSSHESAILSMVPSDPLYSWAKGSFSSSPNCNCFVLHQA